MSVATAEQFSASLDFLMNPASYAPFELTADYKRINGCIDPRDEERDVLKVMVQTPGGSAGEGHDAAIATTIITGQPTTATEGIQSAQRSHLATVMGAHYACRFMSGIGDILAEEAHPSDFTADTIHRWTSYYQLAEDVDPKLGSVKLAAKLIRENEEKIDADAIVSLTSDMYPDHANVSRMVGENNAHIYVVNHHPYVGLNRQAQHRHHNLIIQAYHDSLRGSIEGLKNTVSISNQERGYRLAALLSRSAATRTVLGNLHDDTMYLEVWPEANGLVVKVA